MRRLRLLHVCEREARTIESRFLSRDSLPASLQLGLHRWLPTSQP